MMSQVLWWAGILIVVFGGWMAFRTRASSHRSSPSSMAATLHVATIILVLWSGFLLIAS